MDIEEIKGRQEELKRKEAEWSKIKEALHETARGMLKTIEADIRAAIDLDLEIKTASVAISSDSDGCSVIARNILTITVVRVGGPVNVTTMSCRIGRNAKSGLWTIKVSEHLGEDHESHHYCESNSPALALLVVKYIAFEFPYKHYLWWRGPEDTPKLLAAIVDAIEDKPRPSEFTPQDPRFQSSKKEGCSLVLVMTAAVIVVILLIAVGGMGAHVGP